ncbi:MAG TPA: DUF6062 family protein [Terriglobia bacterium]|nr:DUF6062 family protein [Terriglobia bacterium]
MKNASSSGSTRERRAGWFTTSALKDALAKGGCAVCEALNTSVRRYIFSFLYEGMMSGDAREKFLHGGGFCAQHFRQAKVIEKESWSDGFGIAILCENLLERSLKDIEALRADPYVFKRQRPRLWGNHEGSGRVFQLAPGRDCMVCAMARESEEHYLEAVEELLEESEFAKRYRQSGGFCLGHLRAGAETWTSPAALSAVCEIAQNQVWRLLGELREFQHKHDYQYKHEPRGEEWSSPQRAIEFLTGYHHDVDVTETKHEGS